MSGVKRTTVRVLSAIAFLALVALAVYGTDFITGFIKVYLVKLIILEEKQ